MFSASLSGVLSVRVIRTNMATPPPGCAYPSCTSRPVQGTPRRQQASVSNFSQLWRRALRAARTTLAVQFAADAPPSGYVGSWFDLVRVTCYGQATDTYVSQRVVCA